MDIGTSASDGPIAGPSSTHDLIGGSFAVIESDPDVFTNLLRKLGVRGLGVTEIFDITDPFVGNGLDPRGLIFCYPCSDEGEAQLYDNHEYEDEPDPEAEDLWFSYQLCNDACASQAIVNIILNLENVDIQGPLEEFKRDTEKMSPLMKGLAFTNCTFIRETHNSFARPADLRAALHTAAQATMTYSKKGTKTKIKRNEELQMEETYHFIGYVPANGKIWELNGLRSSGPLEVGEIPEPGNGGLRWMDIVRPALRNRMQRLQNDHIRFNLLAIVDGQYEKISDELEMLKRQRKLLERRLNEEYPDGWLDQVDKELVEESAKAFTTTVLPDGTPGPTFSADFGSKKMDMEMSMLDMPVRKLINAWKGCVGLAKIARPMVEDELRAAERAHTDHINRTFDYQPFIEGFISAMYDESLLQPVLSASTAPTSEVIAASAKSGPRKRHKSKR